MNVENDVTGIAEAFNAGFINVPERPMVKRDYIYASELGAAPIDVYLRTRAVAPTNPPNDRARRKMGAGVDFEYQIKRVLRRADILEDSQVEAKHKMDDCVMVSGRLDFVIGGRANAEGAKEYIENNEELSPNFRAGMMSVIQYYSDKYPHGFDMRPIEFKTIATFGMDTMELSKKPIKRHVLQLYHYLRALGYQYGVLSYLCRDDYRMKEFIVRLDDPIVSTDYENTIKLLSRYLQSGEQPPKEPFVTFNQDAGKFTKNLNVEYSNYLTMLYDFKEPREYGEIYGRKATSWNGVLKRIKEGAKMTAKNEEYIAEAKGMGFDMLELAELYKQTNDETEVDV